MGNFMKMAGLFGLAIFFGGGASAASLSLSPSASLLDVGDSLTVELQVAGLGGHAAPSLAVFDVDLSYDAALFNFSGVAFGGLLGDVAQGDAATAVDSATADTINLSEVSGLEVNAATCIFCTGPYLEDLQPASFTLASLHFTAIAAGTGSFALSVHVFGDAFGEPLAVSLAASPAVTAVPLPAAAWLFGGAAAALSFARRRASLPPEA